MNYDKVWALLRSETNSKRQMARIAKMSPSGFESMMERKTMTVETLEVLAKHFKKELNYFSDKDIPKTPDDTCVDCIEKQKKIDELNEKLAIVQEKYTGCLEELLDKKGNTAKSSIS